MTPPGRAGHDRIPLRGTLVVLWAAITVVLGALLVVARTAEDPLDDPDPAYQRPGLLDAFGLPAPAPAVDATHPAAGARTVVFFTRDDRLEGLCAALAKGTGDLRGATAVVVVASGGSRCPGAVAVVADPAGTLASRYGMRRPRDEGPPVGYAVVDRQRRIRYRTLDPGMAERLDEVGTIVSDVP